jgi:divalent metal cation (Fe/Co/Zn/Cd) transporter
VLGLALVFEGGAWYFALKEFRREKGDSGYLEAVHRGKDPSIFVVLFEDSAAMLGLTVALIATALTQLTGNLYLDGVASIVIGLILAGTAVWLAVETKSLLIGESANNHVVRGIRKLALTIRNINHVNEVLTMHMGPDFILVNISVEFSDQATATDIEDAVALLDDKIKKAYENVQRVFIEAEARHSVLPSGVK